MEAAKTSDEELAKLLETLVEDNELMEVGRKAVEDCLIEMRDSYIFTIRNNGLVVKTKDGKSSDIIRLGPEQGVAVALRAIANKLREG